jgi:hypothetical protein
MTGILDWLNHCLTTARTRAEVSRTIGHLEKERTR